MKNKVAIITGSTMGIGKKLAIALAEKGTKIVLNGRNEKRLEQCLEEFQSRGFEVIGVSGERLQVRISTSLDTCNGGA